MRTENDLQFTQFPAKAQKGWKAEDIRCPAAIGVEEIEFNYPATSEVSNLLSLKLSFLILSVTHSLYCAIKTRSPVSTTTRLDPSLVSLLNGVSKTTFDRVTAIIEEAVPNSHAQFNWRTKSTGASEMEINVKFVNPEKRIKETALEFKSFVGAHGSELATYLINEFAANAVRGIKANYPRKDYTQQTFSADRQLGKILTELTPASRRKIGSFIANQVKGVTVTLKESVTEPGLFYILVNSIIHAE